MERMSDFFAARVDEYDEHMLNDVAGCKEGYLKMAELIPDNAENMLDLGCGTGLELEEIFKRFPDISVTGIDLTKEMLDRLDGKYGGKRLTLINGDYFKADLGESRFDTAVSFQTMHHFDKKEKTGLYKRICASLKPDGVYIECDYMVERQEEEDFLFSESSRIRKEMNIPCGELYHYDTPCTIENQIKMLSRAGFSSAEKVFRIENTTIIVARKNKSEENIE